ncbi:MAG TPA: inorganic diphosphatase [Chitinophagales bacterium]|nr:inorganic diphosphatase [Chitinophagales bacterium]
MNYGKIKTFAVKDTTVNVIIETPKGSRNKYALNPNTQIFELNKILPVGAVFPFNFGFIPRTLAGDGDPLDIIVIMDEASFTGCFLRARVLGVIEATQTENGKPVRNDRIIGVPEDEEIENDLRTLQDLHENVVKEIESFFVSYHAQRGVEFKPLGVGGPKAAIKIIKEARR